MIINYEIKETINNLVSDYVPEGISNEFYVDCRKQVAEIIGALIEKDVISSDDSSIEAVCVSWKAFMCQRFSLLN
jgi:hypothetical protein